MKRTLEMGSSDMINLLSFMKIDTGVEGILRFSLSNLKGSNVGITGGTYEMGSRGMIYIQSSLTIG
jgi:hypothetical protein